MSQVEVPASTKLRISSTCCCLPSSSVDTPSCYPVLTIFNFKPLFFQDIKSLNKNILSRAWCYASDCICQVYNLGNDFTCCPIQALNFLSYRIITSSLF